MEIPQKLQGRIRVTQSGCWNWLGAVVGLRNKTGSRPYGILVRKGQRIRAHRYFYQLATGIDPGKDHVHHLCDNSLCVNPDHLEAMPQGAHNHVHGTFQKRAEAAREQTHCPKGHLWSETAYVWKNQRVCRACTNERQRERRKERGEGLKGQGYNMSSRTHCKQGHPFEGDNVHVTPQGWRMCRTCRNAYVRDLRARHKAARTADPP